jgi:hypothetical protein
MEDIEGRQILTWKEIVVGVMNWIKVAQHRDNRRALVNAQ